MSFKVHEGLIATQDDAFAVGAAIREVLEPEFFRRFKVVLKLAKEASVKEPELTWENFLFLGKEWRSKLTDSRSLSHTLYKAVGALHESSDYDFSGIAIGYDVTLMASGSGGKPLVLVFGQQANDYRELLIEAGVVKRYGYWDNAEEEEGVSEEEWGERARAWAPMGNKSPDELGLLINHPSSLATHIALTT